jgi:hypothetical protein
MQLREISVGPRSKSKVHFEGLGIIQIITELYLSCLKKYDSGEFCKIIIEIGEQVEENGIDRMLNVVAVKKQFDFEKYHRSNIYERKKMVLDVLQEGVLTLAEIDSLDRKPLLVAYDCCMQKGLEYKYLLKDKYYLSPNRKLYAGVWCNWNIDKFEAYVIIFDKNKKEIERIKLMESPYWDLEPMGNAGWDKKTGEFYLFSKDHSHKWTAALIKKEHEDK